MRRQVNMKKKKT